MSQIGNINEMNLENLFADKDTQSDKVQQPQELPPNQESSNNRLSYPNYCAVT
jgi:hypothetical protein